MRGETGLRLHLIHRVRSRFIGIATIGILPGHLHHLHRPQILLRIGSEARRGQGRHSIRARLQDDRQTILEEDPILTHHLTDLVGEVRENATHLG